MGKKILLLGFTKLKYMPYMNFYLKQLAKGDNEIHLLYWNRDDKKDISLPYNVKLHEFKFYQEDEVAKIKKIKGFIKYRKEAKRLLFEEKFDLLVIMHTVPAVLLNDLIIKYYSKRYILDYRDVTFENFNLYKKVIHKLVKYSNATFVSSDAFRVYLPPMDNIYTSHNILLDSLDNRDVRRYKPRVNKPIRIRYWGFIRHESINKKIIERLGNDSRFEIHYHGREQETANNLKHHCKKYGIKNVYFHGEYKPSERYEFAEETDLIHNIFENDQTMQPAMANKFYDGITLYIPQLCNLGSFMGKLVTENGTGFECSPYVNNYADEIYNYYNLISWDSFEKSCDRKLQEVLLEYQKGVNIIEQIVN